MLFKNAVRFRFLLVGLLLVSFATPAMAQNNDPWEPVNKRIYTLNDYLDTLILRPLAISYNTLVPPPVRAGIGNFIYNINDVNVMANNLLQFKFKDAASDSGRILINTTVGLGGLFDVATKAGLERHQEDFGQTLGYWGVKPGPYMVLPLFGPSNLRDTLGFGVDSYVNPIRQIENDAARTALYGVIQIDTRATTIQIENMMFGDEYLFVKEAYLQQRQYLVSDGEVFDDF